MKTQTLPFSEIDTEKLEEIGGQIKEGKVVIIPTDTIYAISGSALIPKTVEKIYLW